MPLSIDQLKEALKDTNPHVRMVAAEVLGSSSQADLSTRLLVQTLGDEDPMVRRVAARSLGVRTQTDAFGPLLEALRDEPIQAAVTRALFAYTAPEYIPRWLQALKDEVSIVRKVAVDVLGELGESSALPGLIAAIQDKAPEVRQSAISSMKRFDALEAAQALIDALSDPHHEVRELAGQTLEAYPYCTAIPALSEALGSEDAFVRQAAVTALGNMNDASVLVPIYERLQDTSAEVRDKAARALQGRQEPVVIDLLIRALKHEHSEVCKLASETLGTFDPERITAPLVEAFFDEDFHDRRYTIELLSKLDASEVIRPLISALDAPQMEVRTMAASTLNSFSSAEVAPLLVQALKDHAFKDKSVAIELLGSLHHPGVLPLLIDALKDEVPYVRAKAASALDGYPDPVPVEPVLEFLTAHSASLRHLAYRLLGRSQDHNAIAPLIGLLDEAGAEDQIELIQALSVFQTPEVVQAISTLLQSEQYPVRQAAVTALQPMQALHAMGPLLDQLAQWDQDAFSIPVSLMVAMYREGHRDRARMLGEALSFHRQDKNLGQSHKLHLTDIKGKLGLEALHELAAQKEWRHVGFFASRDMTGLGYLILKMLKVLNETSFLQKKDARLLLCSRHLTRFVRFKRHGISYLGCRICEHTHIAAKTKKIVAVLDDTMTESLIASEKEYRINWLIRQQIYDYDTVEIGSCNEEEITRFCIDLGNDADPWRSKKARQIQCIILEEASVSGEILAILNRQFNRVVQQ